jgi:hypothetical protein
MKWEKRTRKLWGNLHTQKEREGVDDADTHGRMNMQLIITRKRLHVCVHRDFFPHPFLICGVFFLDQREVFPFAAF